MRPGLDAATAALYADGNFVVHWRHEVANADGTMVDLSDRVAGCSLALPTPSAPIASLTLDFLREPNDDLTQSLAPLVVASALNRLDDGVTYAPLLEIGRVVVSRVALTAPGGVRPADGSPLWYEVFRGHVAGIDWPTWEGGTASIRCNDRFGVLQKTKSEAAYTYTAGTAIEVAIQLVLDRNGFGGSILLHTPTPTGAVLSADYEPGLQKTVWEQVWGLAQSIGGVVWGRYQADGTLALTLFQPDRAKSAPDFTVPRVREVTQLGTDEEEIGNVAYGVFTDADGVRQTVGPIEDAASIARYGGVRRSFWIVEEEDSPIRSAADMTALLTAALSDTADPDAIASYTTPPLLFAEVAVDLYTFSALGRLYDSAQQFAPFSVTIDDRAGEVASSAVQVRGKPSAGSRTWRARRAAPGTISPPPDKAYAIYNIRELSDLSTAEEIALTWDQGPRVTEVWGAARVYTGTRDTAAMWADLLARTAYLSDTPRAWYVPRPAEGEVLPLWLQGRAADGVDRGGWKRVIQGMGSDPIAYHVEVERSEDGSHGTCTVVIDADPRGSVDRVVFAVDSAPPAEAMAVTGGRWSYTVALDEKHAIVVQPQILRTDGRPALWPGAETFDLARSAHVQITSIGYVVDTAVVQVAGDVDTASLWRQESTDGGITFGPATQIAAGRSGNFVVQCSQVGERIFAVFGQTAAGVAGPVRLARISRYVPPTSGAATAVMRVSTDEIAGQGILTLTPVAGASFTSVDFQTKSGTCDWSGWVTDAVAPYSASVPLVEKHLSFVAYRVWDGGQIVQEGVEVFDVGRVAQLLDVSVSRAGDQATVRTRGDSDTAEHWWEESVDGGDTWLTANAYGSGSHASMTLTLYPDRERLLRVWGRNALGEDGPRLTVGLDRYDALPPIIALDDAESATTGTQWWKVQERGLGIASVEVQTQVGDAPASAWGPPLRGAGAASVVRGGVLGAGEWEHDVPLDPRRFSWITVRLTMATGEVMVLGPFGFDRGRTPTLLRAAVSGQTVDVMGDSGDTRSLRVERSDAPGWSQHVDGLAFLFDLARADDLGHAGIGSGERWPVRVTAYAQPRAEVVPGTPSDTRDVVVHGPGAAAGPAWSRMQVDAPPLDSNAATITLQATSAPAGSSVRVSARPSSGAWEEITTTLSPAPSTPPTVAASYTWGAPVMRRAQGPGHLPVSYEIRAEILSSAGGVLATETRALSYYTDFSTS